MCLCWIVLCSSGIDIADFKQILLMTKHINVPECTACIKGNGDENMTRGEHR